MFKSYLKSAFRNLWMHRSFSLINVAGLSIGLASSFIIMLYSVNELSYDRYNENLDNIYLVTTESPEFKWTEPSTPFVLGPALKEQYPDIRQCARWIRSNCPIKYKDKAFESAPCVSADSTLFQILTLPLKSGSLEEISAEKNNVVMSSSMAHRIFGDSNPIGEVITVSWWGEPYDLKVCAVLNDIPRTSTFRAELILPMHIGSKWLDKYWSNLEKNPLESWNAHIVLTYVSLAPSSSVDQLGSKLASFSKSHSNPDRSTQFHLLPLKDIYFRSAGFTNNRFPSGDVTNVYVYSTIAFLTLVIACINFVILSTGRASVRTKEIAVRKVLGATRLDLIRQVMLESVSVAILSLPVALLLVEVFLPSFTQLLGKRLLASYYHSLGYLFLFTGITLVAGILSGSYVSFYLSGFQPMDIMRNKLSTGPSKATLRKIMIAIQMVIFVGLITGSLTIYKQVRYLHNKDMGFDKEDLLVLYPENRNIGASFDAFKAELLSDPSITTVTGAPILPGSGSGGFSVMSPKSNPLKKVPYQVVIGDREFIEAMKMNMVYGKSFAEATPEEAKSKVILNESALKAFEIVDLSQEMVNGQQILGVVRDFNMRSLHEAVGPVVLACGTQYMREIAVRVQHTANIAKTIKFIESKSASFNNGKPMNPQFFDERLDDLYGDNYRFGTMIGYFTSLAIFIACLGLFGVSLFVIQARVKEIGIRKVLGASVGTLLYSITKEFVILIVISAIIAIPITTYLINSWLQNYAYKVSVDVVVVLLSLLAAMIIVLLTIGYQAIRAATANPVEALRYE